MGYIPGPTPGVLKVQAAMPAPVDGIAWWETTTGRLSRYSNTAADWMGVGEPEANPGTVILGRMTSVGGLYMGQSVGIGNDITIDGYECVVIGDYNLGTADASIAIGNGCFCQNTDPVTFISTPQSSITIGSGCNADNQSVVIGSGTSSHEAAFIGAGSNVAIGSCIVTNSTFGVALNACIRPAAGVSVYRTVAMAGGLVEHTRSMVFGEAPTTANHQVRFSAKELRVIPGAYYGPPGETSIVLTSADDTPWRVTISNAGAIVVAPA